MTDIPILNSHRHRIPPEEILARLEQDVADRQLISAFSGAIREDLIEALRRVPPTADTVEIPVGPGETLFARLATNWTTMRFAGDSGQHVGLALATGPRDAIVARMDAAQSEKLILDLADKHGKAINQRGS